MRKITNQVLKWMGDRPRTQILVVVLWARIVALQLVSKVLAAFGEPPMTPEASVHLPVMRMMDRLQNIILSFRW